MTTVKTETSIKQIKLNKLSQEQYLAALKSGQIHDDEVYMTPDTSIEQFDHMPVASFEFQDKLVQYIGEEESGEETFVYGYFYKCVALGTEPETYEWQQINVQPAPDMSSKVDKVSTADRVYGTDSSGNQTTYDKNSFGQVDDVQIHGDSKVVNKIANLSVVEQLTTMPAISEDNYGRIVQYIGATTQDYTHGYFYQAEALRVDSSKSVSADNATVTIANSEKYFAWLTRLQTILGENRPIGFYILKTSNGTTYSADVYDTNGVSGAASGSRDTVNDWGLSFSGFENYDSETGTGTVLHLDVVTGWTLISVQPITVDDQLSTTSTNPVQNKVITEELNKKSGVIFRQIIEEDNE